MAPRSWVIGLVGLVASVDALATKTTLHIQINASCTGGTTNTASSCDGTAASTNATLRPEKSSTSVALTAVTNAAAVATAYTTALGSVFAEVANVVSATQFFPDAAISSGANTSGGVDGFFPSFSKVGHTAASQDGSASATTALFTKITYELELVDSWLPGQTNSATIVTPVTGTGPVTRFATGVRWNGAVASNAIAPALVPNAFYTTGMTVDASTATAWVWAGAEVPAASAADQLTLMEITKAVTDFSGGEKVWMGGFRLEHIFKTDGAAATVSTSDGNAGAAAEAHHGQATIAGSMCAAMNTVMAGDSVTTETALSIRCESGLPTSGASGTAVMEFANEFDLKWAAAFWSLMPKDSTAQSNTPLTKPTDYAYATSTKIYGQTETGSPTKLMAASYDTATYTAKATATAASGKTWEADEACRFILKHITRHNRHSAWASCKSTTSGVMSLTFWDKYDIQKTFRGMAMIDLTSATDLLKVEPTDVKDGDTMNKDGEPISTTIPTFSVQVSNGDETDVSKSSKYSIRTVNGYCAKLDALLLSDSNIVFCDDKTNSVDKVVADGSTVDLKFGTSGVGAQLRTLLTEAVTVASPIATSQMYTAVAGSSNLSSGVYVLTYTLTAAAGKTILPAPEAALNEQGTIQKNPFAVTDSGCFWIASVGTAGTDAPIWCSSTATTMTVWFADAAQAKDAAKQIGALLDRATIASATPTSAKMRGGSEMLQSIEYLSAFATGQTALVVPTEDAVTSTVLADSICKVVSDTNTDHIFCDGLKAAGSTVTLKYLTLADLRTAGKALMSTQTQETPAPAVAVYVQLLTPKAGQTYTATYTVTLSKDGEVPPAPTPFGVSVGKLTSTNSACAGYTAANNCIFCASDTAGGMTMHWVTHDDRTTDGVAISGVGAADPTSITDPTSVTPPAKITTLKYTVRSDTDDTAWTASDGKRGQAASACKIANDVITHHKAVYCKSLKESGSEMTLKFFAAADALDNAQSIRQTKSGTPTAKEVRFAVPVADTLYTAAYSLTAAVDTNGDAATVTADAVGADGDGCKFLAKANSAYCMGDESSTTLYFLGAAARRTDLTKLAKVAGSGNIGHVVLDAVKDQAVAGTLVSLSYKTTNDKGEDFKKDAFNTAVAGSACGKGSGLKMFVSCASVVANEGTTVWKWITGADDVTATPDYVSDARKLADMANADKTQVFELLGESASPSVVTSSYSVAILTTTLKPTRRSLAVQDGDVESTGGFTLANSWCKVLSASAPNAIFCTSDTGSATFTHLQDAGTDTATLAATDSRALNAVTTHYVALTPAMKVEITLAVNKNLKADALCSKWNGAGIKNVASCAHETVEIPAPTRRRLTTASVKVTLGFLTQGDLTAAKTAYDVIDWEKKFTEVEGAPGPLVSIGDLTPTPTPTPIAATPGGNVGTPATPTPKKPSSAALRVVGVVVLAGFLAV